MLCEPMDVLRCYQVRKSKKQKEAFRDAVCEYAESLGYGVAVEKGSLGARNIVIGDPGRAQYLVTAHYDTPARMLLPNLITPCNFWTFLLYQLVMVVAMMIPPAVFGVAVGWISGDSYTGFLVWYFLYLGMLILMMAGPANKHNANDNTSGVITLLEIAKNLDINCRDRVAFVLFDLEELGMVGSSSYRSRHKAETEDQIVLNMDCVGDGEEILLFPMKKLKKDSAKMAALRMLCREGDGKSIALREKGFSVYPSDQTKFPYGVGIAAFNRWKGILYCDRIHTSRDTLLDQSNIIFIRSAVMALLADET